LFGVDVDRWNFGEEIAYHIENLRILADENERKAKSDKDADNKDGWATTYMVDGKVWAQMGCNLNEINTSCISISCLQYLPKSLLKFGCN
jgi:hypothetical protein